MPASPSDSDISPSRQGSRFRYYLSGIGAGSLLSGLHIVLYPWLVTGVLGESPERVGLAQMLALLPSLLFILLGGALSEVNHPGKLLVRLYLLYLLPYSLLLVLALNGSLNFSLVVVFGFSYGLITSFVQPARESLLPKVVDGPLQQAVARVSLVQFLLQSVGILFAGQLGQFGLVTLLVIQLIAILLTALLIRRSFASQGGQFSVAAMPKAPPIGTIRSGLKLVWGDKPLLHLMLVVAVTGFLGLGVYIVAMPLLAREVYQAGAGFYATLQLTFTAGVIVANLLVMRGVGKHWQPGKVLLLSLLFRGLLLALIACDLAVWLLFPVVLCWGVMSGWSMVLGRTLAHKMAPEDYLSRVVSVYQLALFGAAPLGAWLCGQLVAKVGVLQAMGWFSWVTLFVVGWMIRRGALWHWQANNKTEQVSVER